MYASPFEYLAARTWEEALALLGAHADADPRLLAGGQSLGPMMNLRLAEPSHLIDLNTIAPQTIRREGDNLVIPALTRHHELASSELIRADCPLLGEAAALIGNVRVRHRGTFGGSLAHADPSAELPCAALAAEATVIAQGRDGPRPIPASEFFVSFFTTALEAGQLVREVQVPALPPRTGWSFQEFVRRAGDFALIEVAATIGFDGSGDCTRATVAIGGVGERPVRLPEVETMVREDQTAAGIEAAAARASSLVEPPDTESASAEYRRHLAGVLVRRALSEALERAEGRGSS